MEIFTTIRYQNLNKIDILSGLEVSEVAKVYKFTGYVADYDDVFGTAQKYLDYINDRDGYCLGISAFEIKESDEFEWDDNIAINMVDCSQSEYDKYFIGK